MFCIIYKPDCGADFFPVPSFRRVSPSRHVSEVAIASYVAEKGGLNALLFSTCRFVAGPELFISYFGVRTNNEAHVMRLR